MVQGPIIRDRAFSVLGVGDLSAGFFQGLAAVLLLIAAPSPVWGQQGTAALLTPGDPQQVPLRSGDESHWICVPPNLERGIVWFFAESADAGATGTLRIRTARGETGSPVWVRTKADGAAPEAFISTGPGSGPLMAKIWAETEPEFDGGEPNDEFKDATRLSGEGNRFFLYPQADQDWFVFHLARSSTYQIAVRVPRGGGVFREGLELGVSDREQRPLIQRIGQLDSQGTWKTVPFELKAGEYRCWVRARGNRFSRFPLMLGMEHADGTAASPILSPPDPAPAPTPERVTPAEPPRNGAGSPIAPRIVLGVLVGMILWWGAALLRPRRVFDLTR
jgi:hypothetical protein